MKYKIILYLGTQAGAYQSPAQFETCYGEKFKLKKSDLDYIQASSYAIGQSVKQAISNFTNACRNIESAVSQPYSLIDQIMIGVTLGKQGSVTASGTPSVDDLFVASDDDYYYRTKYHGFGCKGYDNGSSGKIYQIETDLDYSDANIEVGLNKFISWDKFTGLITDISDTRPLSGNYVRFSAKLKLVPVNYTISRNSSTNMSIIDSSNQTLYYITKNENGGGTYTSGGIYVDYDTTSSSIDYNGYVHTRLINYKSCSWDFSYINVMFPSEVDEPEVYSRI